MKKLKQIASKYFIELAIAGLFGACVVSIVVINNPVTVHEATPSNDSLKVDSLIKIDSLKVDSLTVDTIK